MSALFKYKLVRDSMETAPQATVIVVASTPYRSTSRRAEPLRFYTQFTENFAAVWSRHGHKFIRLQLFGALDNCCCFATSGTGYLIVYKEVLLQLGYETLGDRHHGGHHAVQLLPCLQTASRRTKCEGF